MNDLRKAVAAFLQSYYGLYRKSCGAVVTSQASNDVGVLVTEKDLPFLSIAE